tara:strand:+ start:2398 stop:3237 length:840 start_codon:yes stop_codon:yes gene_type:complete
MKFPTPLFEAEGIGGGGGADEGAGTRPEYVPEKFWNAETGQTNVEAMATSYSESETRLSEITRGGKTAEEWDVEARAKITEELSAESLAGRPETSEAYEYVMPDDLELPEGVEWTMDENDPLLAWWKTTAFNNGMTQEQFNAGVGDYIKQQAGSLPDYDKEMKALGENAQRRVDGANLWAKANLSEGAFSALESYMTEAKGIELVEEIMGLTKVGRMNPGGEAPKLAKVKSRTELIEMQKDKRYWDSNYRDESYVAEVSAAWAAAFPGEQGTAPLNPSG